MAKDFLTCLTANALFILMLQPGLYCLGSKVISEIPVNLGDEVSLSCISQVKEGVPYWAISWYKVADDGIKLSGIIFNNLKEKTPRKYRGCSLVVKSTPSEPYSLIISNISSEDLGMYQCFLWAPIGEENKKGFMNLKEMGHTSLLSLNWTIPLIAVFCLLSLLCLCFMIMKITRGRENYRKLINTDLRNSVQIQIEEPIKDKLNST
ncbi:CD83 antigen [Hypanus sabinus]|uniref:CD83 antigen n=1 Tax=Hypanus sabinus TaxID=79690 RepID=UPI0028C3FE54|nr:CD83 antigen [Hypanus sabinus]